MLVQSNSNWEAPLSDHRHDEPHAPTRTHAEGMTHDHDHAEQTQEHRHADGMTHDHAHGDHEHGKRPGFLARLFGAR